MATIFLKGKYAPGGYDWFHCTKYYIGHDGVTCYYNEHKYFFPWESVERIEG